MQLIRRPEKAADPGIGFVLICHAGQKAGVGRVGPLVHRLGGRRPVDIGAMELSLLT